MNSVEEIRNFLYDVSVKVEAINEAKKLFADKLAPEFMIFDYLGNDENTISKCFADLLNPKGKHEQQSIYLEIFLDMLSLPDTWKHDAENCTVETEKIIDKYRRLDIFLNFTKTGVIGIENKPWAEDQDNQLFDYAKYLEKISSGKNWVLVYISNRDPSERSIPLSYMEKLKNNGNFIRVSYREIEEWLHECACKTKALVVRVFIEELAKYIRNKINEVLDMSYENEIKKIILESENNISAAFYIGKTLDNVKKELFERFLMDLECSLKEKGFEIEISEELKKWQLGSKYNFFRINLEKGRIPNFYLSFEFEIANLSGFEWGISRKSEDIIRKEQQWDEIHQIMTKAFWQGKKFDWWPWITYGTDEKRFGKDFIDWYNSEKPWIMIFNGSLVELIVKLAEDVRNAFNEENKLDLLFS